MQSAKILVGGRVFVVSGTVRELCPAGSVLRELTAHNEEIDGLPFYDRDPQALEVILNVVRCKKLYADRWMVALVEDEASFWGVDLDSFLSHSKAAPSSREEGAKKPSEDALPPFLTQSIAAAQNFRYDNRAELAQLCALVYDKMKSAAAVGMVECVFDYSDTVPGLNLLVVGNTAAIREELLVALGVPRENIVFTAYSQTRKLYLKMTITLLQKETYARVRAQQDLEAEQMRDAKFRPRSTVVSANWRSGLVLPDSRQQQAPQYSEAINQKIREMNALLLSPRGERRESVSS